MEATPPEGALVAECLRRGRAAFPELRTDDAAIARRIASRLSSVESLEHIEAEALFLAACCEENDPGALRLFESRYGPEVDDAARSLRGDASFSTELRQRVFQHILVGSAADGPRIAHYAARGPLGAWVRVAAVRMGISLLREEQRPGRVSDEEDWAEGLSLPGAGTPELDLIKAQYAREFRNALTRACHALGDRERSMLRMHFADGLNIDRIGEAYGVHRATAARWIAHAREELMKKTRTFLQVELKVTASEWDSVLRLIQSQISISMSALLPPDADAPGNPDAS